MRKNKVSVLLACSFFASCASFQPRLRLHDALGDRKPTAMAEQENLEVAVEEFISEENPGGHSMQTSQLKAAIRTDIDLKVSHRVSKALHHLTIGSKTVEEKTT